MQLKRSWLAGLISVVAVLIFSLSFVGKDEYQARKLQPPPVVSPDRQIEVGMHIQNIYNISLQDKTFNADGWYWLKWPESIQKTIETDEIPITQLVELVNQVESYDSYIEADGNKPKRLAKGGYLQAFRFSCRFYDDRQDLRGFPFVNLDLPITVELRPSEFSLGQLGVSLVPRLNVKELEGDSLNPNGYLLVGSRVSNAIHTYRADFGEGTVSNETKFSMVNYEILYSTNNWAAFYRFVLPWLAVMVIVVLTPNLEGNLSELRIAIPSTALLTLVFLQEGAHQHLPPLGYLSYLDKLYLFGYIAATTEFCLFVWSTNAFSRCSSDEQSKVMARINRIDLTYQLCAVTGMACLLLLGRSAG
jgi:hypothetical protein